MMLNKPKVKSAIMKLIFISLILFQIYFVIVLIRTKNISSTSIPSNKIILTFPSPSITQYFLPALYTDGVTIKRKDTNEVVVLKGVSTNLFRWEDYPKVGYIEKFYDRLKLAMKWKINLVGFILGNEVTLENINRLDEIVAFSKKNGIYIYLIPVADDPLTKSSVILQLSKFEKLMGSLANRYKNETHILYGLCAEPKTLTWDEWLSHSIRIASEIRKVNSNAILLMTGINYGRDFSGMEEKPFPYKNVIYTVTDYAFADKQDAINYLNLITESKDWEWMINKYPLLIGEFGGMWKEDFQTYYDLAYIKSILEVIEKNRLSYTAYSIDAGEKLSLLDPDGQSLTKKGELFFEYFNKYPPTQFK